MTTEGTQPTTLDDSRVIDEIERYRHVPTSERPEVRADLLAKYPGLCDELNACLDGLELLSAWPADNGTGESHVDLALPDSQNLGDFRIVRELGRGGMGVVYEAEQLSLGRRVALKVLPFAAFLDARRLQRFKQEAQAAAMLRHPNIVTVFCVGCERGVHYYAMELVEGTSFADLSSSLASRHTSGAPASVTEMAISAMADTRPIASLSTQHGEQPTEYHRSIARLGATLAEAIHYAHEQGVVHRDLKPSNLLLDYQGTPWITDFGLAQVTDDRGLTMSGDLLGTLRYMSPEQADGNKLLDHRTDIYSLGATLFELLTLHPALNGKDRPQILRQLEHHQPARARSLDPRIPKDLETILLKAMATRAEDRYQSARDVADDLRRFLDRKPITARRPGRGHRMIRWVQRHPAKSMLLFTVALLVATLAIGGPLVAFSYSRLADREAASRRDLQRLLSETLTIATERLENTPNVGGIHEKLLSDTLRQYERLLEHADDDPDLLFEHARGCIRLGAVINLRFDPVQATEVVETGVDILEQLVRDYPQRAEYKFQLTQGYFELATMAWSTDKAKSVAIHRESVKLLEWLVAQDPRSPHFRAEFALTQHYLSGVLAQLGEVREAEMLARLSQASLAQLAAEHPTNAHYLAWQAESKHFLCRHLRQTGRIQEATAEIREAVGLVELLPATTRQETRVRIGVAVGLKTFAACLRELQQVDEAEAVLRDAFAELNDVLQGFPDSEWARNASIWVSQELAETLVTQGRSEEAASILQAAMKSFEHSATYRQRNAYVDPYTCSLLALVCWQLDRHIEARELLDRLLTAPEQAAPQIVSWLFACSPYMEQRNAQKALIHAEQCPDQPAVTRERLQGMALYRLGRPREARIHLQRANELTAVPDPEILLFLAMAEYSVGEKSASLATWRQARTKVEASYGIHAAVLRHLAEEARDLFGESM